jgi:hypothetical protein
MGGIIFLTSADGGLTMALAQKGRRLVCGKGRAHLSGENLPTFFSA